MARKSSIEKNKNRANKVAMHANKRSRLKAIVTIENCRLKSASAPV